MDKTNRESGRKSLKVSKCSTKRDEIDQRNQASNSEFQSGQLVSSTPIAVSEVGLFDDCKMKDSKSTYSDDDSDELFFESFYDFKPQPESTLLSSSKIDDSENSDQRSLEDLETSVLYGDLNDERIEAWLTTAHVSQPTDSLQDIAISSRTDQRKSSDKSLAPACDESNVKSLVGRILLGGDSLLESDNSFLNTTAAKNTEFGKPALPRSNLPSPLLSNSYLPKDNDTFPNHAQNRSLVSKSDVRHYADDLILESDKGNIKFQATSAESLFHHDEFPLDLETDVSYPESVGFADEEVADNVRCSTSSDARDLMYTFGMYLKGHAKQISASRSLHNKTGEYDRKICVEKQENITTVKNLDEYLGNKNSDYTMDVNEEPGIINQNKNFETQDYAVQEDDFENGPIISEINELDYYDSDSETRLFIIENNFDSEKILEEDKVQSKEMDCESERCRTNQNQDDVYLRQIPENKTNQSLSSNKDNSNELIHNDVDISIVHAHTDKKFPETQIDNGPTFKKKRSSISTSDTKEFSISLVNMNDSAVNDGSHTNTSSLELLSQFEFDDISSDEEYPAGFLDELVSADLKMDNETERGNATMDEEQVIYVPEPIIEKSVASEARSHVADETLFREIQPKVDNRGKRNDFEIDIHTKPSSEEETSRTQHSMLPNIKFSQNECLTETKNASLTADSSANALNALIKSDIYQEGNRNERSDNSSLEYQTEMLIEKKEISDGRERTTDGPNHSNLCSDMATDEGAEICRSPNKMTEDQQESDITQETTISEMNASLNIFKTNSPYTLRKKSLPSLQQASVYLLKKDDTAIKAKREKSKKRPPSNVRTEPSTEVEKKRKVSTSAERPRTPERKEQDDRTSADNDDTAQNSIKNQVSFSAGSTKSSGDGPKHISTNQLPPEDTSTTGDDFASEIRKVKTPRLKNKAAGGLPVSIAKSVHSMVLRPRSNRNSTAKSCEVSSGKKVRKSSYKKASRKIRKVNGADDSNSAATGNETSGSSSSYALHSNENSGLEMQSSAAPSAGARILRPRKDHSSDVKKLAQPRAEKDSKAKAWLSG